MSAGINSAEHATVAMSGEMERGGYFPYQWDTLALRQGGVKLALRCHSGLKRGDVVEVHVASL